MRDQIEVKIFFLEITMILGEHQFLRDFLENFFGEHQFLNILASQPYFEYPSLAKTLEITLLFLSIQ